LSSLLFYSDLAATHEQYIVIGIVCRDERREMWEGYGALAFDVVTKHWSSSEFDEMRDSGADLLGCFIQCVFCHDHNVPDPAQFAGNAGAIVSQFSELIRQALFSENPWSPATVCHPRPVAGAKAAPSSDPRRRNEFK
jgi:hypothetical protein